MLVGLFIFVDDDFADPIYAEPELDDLDHDLGVFICQMIDDVIEGDRPNAGVVDRAGTLIGYKHNSRTGISHVAVVSDGVAKDELVEFLGELAQTYVDEVDVPRLPERDGVAELVEGIYPPWDE